MSTEQIIALGGGGLSLAPEDLTLARYILEQSGKERPKVCFIPTASGDSDRDLRRFYESFCTLGCQPQHLSLFAPPCEDLEPFVLEQDVIYVGGGNTRNLLALWREWGLDQILRTAYRRGVVLAGVSAGSLCWFEQGVTDSLTPPGSKRLSSIPCLGFLPGSNCPHYDGEPHRRPEFHRLLREGSITPGYATDDCAALHFRDGLLSAVVSSRPNARAYAVAKQGEEIVETALIPEPCPAASGR